MDVTFFETQPYYPKIDIQGENSTQEYQFWNLESLSESPITTKNKVSIESCNQPEFIVDLWDNEHIQEEMRKEHFLSKPMRLSRVLIQAKFQVAMLLTQMVLLIQS